MNLDDIIRQYGPPGIPIFLLLIGLKIVWGRLIDCQDRRIAELRETLSAMGAMTNAANAVADGLAALKTAIEQRMKGDPP